MNDVRYQSWGCYPKANQQVVFMRWRQDLLSSKCPSARTTFLPYGNGRSYGDSCLNDGGTLIDTRGLDRFIHFDRENGVLCCEAGVVLAEILELIVPQGWFLPVTPGTRFVTLGGAIANDVHGKNHHRAGSFGRHVRSFELLRSDGNRIICSHQENADWFRATIGGLGLTGLMTWAEIQLKPIRTPYIHQQTMRYGCLNEFFRISARSDRDCEYTVAWVDCLARGKALGRGLFFVGDHVDSTSTEVAKRRRVSCNLPVRPPVSLVNRASLRLFNCLYYYRHRASYRHCTVHYEPFFYPLDGLGHWNWLYGPRGFMQYQCLVPDQQGEAAIEEILGRIAASGMGSFLAVLKVFGDKPSPGLLSFPTAGITLALDFPNRGKKTLELLDSLDEVVRVAGGRVYPGKDARMSPESFATYYPRWSEVKPYIDPQFSSSFWRRVTGEHGWEEY